MRTKNLVNLCVFALLIVGASSAGLILYNYLETPHIISRQQALEIATKKGNWTDDFLENKKLDMKLLHIREGGRFALIVDEKTLEDIMPFCPQSGKCVELEEVNPLAREGHRYVWIITAEGLPPTILSHRTWGFMIDAETGKTL